MDISLNIPLKKRLWILSAVLVMSVLAIGLISLELSNSLVKTFRKKLQTQLPAIQFFVRAHSAQSALHALTLRTLLLRDTLTPAELNKIMAQAKLLGDNNLEYTSRFMSAFTEVQKDETSDKVAKLGAVSEEYVKTAKFKIHEVGQGVRSSFSEAITQLEKQDSLLQKAFTEIENDLLGSGVMGKASGANDALKGNIINLVFVIFGVFIIALLSSMFLTLENRLRRLVGILTRRSTELQTSVDSVKSSSHELSEASTEQAAAIEQTTTSMTQVTKRITETTQSMVDCKTQIDKGRQEGVKGKEVVEKLYRAMEEIRSASLRLATIVKAIEEIKSKTTVINDIVFETRLLSFNASIEAARAGIHGKGFSVVAEEVGKLAVMSGKAAEEIRILLDSSTSQVLEVVSGTQETVKFGREVSQECEVSFRAITDALEAVGKSVTETVANCKEQLNSAEHIKIALDEIGLVTHKNSKGAIGLADLASQLFGGMSSVNKSVLVMQSIIQTGRATTHPTNAVNDISLISPEPEDLPSREDVPKNSNAEGSSPERNDSRWKNAA